MRLIPRRCLHTATTATAQHQLHLPPWTQMSFPSLQLRPRLQTIPRCRRRRFSHLSHLQANIPNPVPLHCHCVLEDSCVCDLRQVLQLSPRHSLRNLAQLHQFRTPRLFFPRAVPKQTMEQPPHRDTRASSTHFLRTVVIPDQIYPDLIAQQATTLHPLKIQATAAPRIFRTRRLLVPIQPHLRQMQSQNLISPPMMASRWHLHPRACFPARFDVLLLHPMASKTC